MLIIICGLFCYRFILFGSGGTIFGIYKLLSSYEVLEDVSAEYKWIVHGIFNVLGYSTILVPGYLLYLYINKVNYLDKAGMSYS